MTDLPAIKYLDMAAKAADYIGWGTGSAFRVYERKSIIAHARTLEEADRLSEALAKYEPVDEDEAALAAILNEWRVGDLHYTVAGYAELFPSSWTSALAQYKAERLTITDDDALLIAREICARVADGIFHVENYRDGTYDDSPEVQFAFAMVKRDPTALEAFRGVA